MPKGKHFLQILLAIGIVGSLGVMAWKDREAQQAITCHSLEHFRYQAAEVRHLELSYVPLETFPTEILENEQLITFCRNGNVFSAKKMEQLKRDSILEEHEWNRLCDFKFQTLPPEINRWAYLEALEIPNNLLTSIPSEIGALQNLQKIDLHGNKLQQLPESLGQLKKLTYANFSDNYLSALPKEIGNCLALKELSLSDNYITTVPAVWKHLPALESLDLSNNKIQQLPDSLQNWRSLQWLNLSGNSIVPIERDRICKALPFTKILF